MTRKKILTVSLASLTALLLAVSVFIAERPVYAKTKYIYKIAGSETKKKVRKTSASAETKVSVQNKTDGSAAKKKAAVSTLSDDGDTQKADTEKSDAEASATPIPSTSADVVNETSVSDDFKDIVTDIRVILLGIMMCCGFGAGAVLASGLGKK